MFRTRKEELKGLKIIISGCGKVGATLIEQLSKEGHDITIIDKRAEAIEFRVDQASAVTNVSLIELPLKKNLLIWFINRSGTVLKIESFLMLLPCAVAVIYRERNGVYYLAVSALCMLLGYWMTRRKP